MVVDSNQLQSSRLRQYLEKSSLNKAILTDYVAMEAYKGDTLESIYKSMAILAEFPIQVLVLKATSVVCGLRGGASELIDLEQTSGFPNYVHKLNLARLGDKSLERSLLELGKNADSHMNRMLRSSPTIASAIDGIVKDRKRRPYVGKVDTSEPQLIHIKDVMLLAAMLFRNHSCVTGFPTSEALPQTFIFRVALCALLVALDWGTNGSRAVKANVDKVRNDMVDAHIAAYATLFDGLLSNDAKMIRIYEGASRFLSEMPDANRA